MFAKKLLKTINDKQITVFIAMKRRLNFSESNYSFNLCSSLKAKSILEVSEIYKGSLLFDFECGHYQRWSRGHKKISRPRPRTDPLEAKGQGHRRKCSPKKGLQKFFSGEKGLQKFFFRRFLLQETKKKGLCRFSARFLAFSNDISTVQK